MNKKNEIKVIKCDAKRLQELVDKSAFTIEGLAESSFGDLLDWIEQHTKMKTRRVFLTAGALANSEWGLHGDNAYSDDLNIVSVLLDDMEDWKKIVMPRFQIGARWMDDIRDNNVRREAERV
jgi:hypothetical protein